MSTSEPEPHVELHANLDRIIAQLGPDAARRALENAYLFLGLRQQSRKALSTARDWWAEGLPAQLVVGLTPGAKKAGERVEIRVITGTTTSEITVRTEGGHPR